MKKAISLLPLTFCIICSVSYGDGQPKYILEGLTDEIYYKLSGVWVEDADRNWRTKEAEFSWGKGRHVVNSSTEIDLGWDPPILQIPGGPLFSVLSIIEIDKNKYKLKLFYKARFGDDLSPEVVIQVNKDGSMLLDASKILDGAREYSVYYKLCGPEIPK